MKKSQVSHHRWKTPQNRLKRANAYRNAVRTKKHAVFQKTENRVSRITQNATSVDWTENTNVVQKVVERTQKKTKDAWLNDMVTQQNVSFWEAVFQPLKTMQKAKDAEEIVISYFKGFLWHLWAWFMFSGCIAHLYQRSIELQAYSLARFNFTDTCWLAVRITLFGLIFEYLAYEVIYCIGIRLHNQCPIAKVMEGDALTAPLTVMVFLFSLLALWILPVFGILLFIAAVGAIGVWKIYTLHEMIGYDWKLVIILVATYVACGLCFYGIYYETTMQDLVKIYKLL